MAHAYLIYQRLVDAEFQAELNYEIQSPRATAYFNIAMVGMGHEPDTAVAEAIKHELYQPTMFMIGMGKHSSMSVGDLVVNLLDNSVQVCMPMGWYELFDTNLNLNVA